MCSVVVDACGLLCENYSKLMGAQLSPECENIGVYVRDASSPPEWADLDSRIASTVVGTRYT